MLNYLMMLAGFAMIRDDNAPRENAIGASLLGVGLARALHAEGGDKT